MQKEPSGFVSVQFTSCLLVSPLGTALMSESGLSHCQGLSTAGPLPPFQSYW